ncbi:hypothetical protein [Cohnella mopanensis]|uniref:hypothetical protein n=1 Tax=Cohnella mopanensis TaxID=2911966 RepID=UPI001EF823A7|nr:hypothetical protein [Cohnella mopanensis]
MKNKLVTMISLIVLTLSMPAFVAAAPHEHEHHHSGQPPVLDWSSYPADIQALKSQLDQIRTEQKGLFEQMRSQSAQIKDARKTLSSDQRNTLKKPAKMLIEQMKVTRDAIHELRKQKHEAWDSFHEHASGKQWSSAKEDLQKIIKQKQQILDKQQSIVKLQKQLIVLINPSHESHIHIED